MMTKQADNLQIIHSHTQLVHFLRDDFTLLSSMRHCNYKAILIYIAQRADKAKDWSCYRTQNDIATSIFGDATPSNLRLVKRAFKRFYELGLLEVIGRDRVEYEKDGAKVNGLGKNYYRFTDKLLHSIGLVRHTPSMPRKALQKLWGDITDFLRKTSRSLECQT